MTEPDQRVALLRAGEPAKPWWYLEARTRRWSAFAGVNASVLVVLRLVDLVYDLQVRDMVFEVLAVASALYFLLPVLASRRYDRAHPPA